MAEAAPRTTLTVITPIKPDRLTDLTKRLGEIDRDVRDKGECPLPGLKDDIHVMRWVILPRAVRESGVTVPASLVLWTVFDSALEVHLGALTKGGARSRLDEIYAHCEGYPTGGSALDVEAYLKGHAPNHDWVACFDGILGHKLQQIKGEEQLREELKKYLDNPDMPGDPPNWQGWPQTHVHLRAKKWLKERERSDFKWERECPATPKAPSLQRYAWIAAAIGVALLMVFGVAALLVTATVLGVLLLLLGLWSYLLHRAEVRAEQSRVEPARRWFADHDVEIGERENEVSGGLNRLTILTDLHPGFIRALTMRVVLWVVNFRATRTVDGKLQGIQTIHFAQWRLVDGGRRLLFITNYDGRADDYFRDFSDNAAPGVNAIWSNTVGFPPTTLLIGNGSRDLPRFQRAARTYQIPTDVWYFGYPDRSFTVRRIHDNTRIHQGLATYLTPPEVKEWLELIYADAT